MNGRATRPISVPATSNPKDWRSMAAAFDDARTGTTWSTPNDHRTAADGSAESSLSRGSDYAQLSRRVRRAGLLDRRPAYYTAKIALNLVLLAAGWTAFVLLGDSWYQFVVAAWLALVAGQVAFVGHDAGHRQIFRTRRPNDLVGLVHANPAARGELWLVGGQAQPSPQPPRP
jgi:hypothetical protein